MAHLSKSVELNPSFALGHAGLGYALACGGEPERGLLALEQAERLSPRDPFLAFYAPTVRYMALFALERYEEAIAVCRATVGLASQSRGRMAPDDGIAGAARSHRRGQSRRSRIHCKLQPDLSADHVEKNTVFANPSDRSRFLLGLRKAGLDG